MASQGVVVAVYTNDLDALAAINALQKSGFSTKKLSIVGKDDYAAEQVVGYYTAGDRMKYWGKMSAFWGRLWGSLDGAAFFLDT